VDRRGVDVLDRHAEPALYLGARGQLREALLRGRQEEVADLLEQRRAELLEEAHARSPTSASTTSRAPRSARW
jgi:hypothetical protein